MFRDCDVVELKDGLRAELYAKAFAKEARIASDIAVNTESTIKLLDRYNQHNLSWARMYLERRPEMQTYPFVNDWIDSVIKGQDYPGRIDEPFKAQVKETLLDTAFATDLIVRLNDNRGKSQIIAIDVTVKLADKDSKLRKIRGQREDGDSTKKFNPNGNYPKLRTMLAINKHIVLVMDAKQYPSYATLLTEIYAVANQPAQTAALDLSQIKEVDAAQFIAERTVSQKLDSPNLWAKYSQGVSSVSAQLTIDVTKRAITAKHTKTEILQMLTDDPQYRQFAKRDKGDLTSANQYATAIFNKVVGDLSIKNDPEGPAQQPQQRRGPRRSR
jgi:hypothetical protein